MEPLTLETLPKTFRHLQNDVSEIKQLLLEKETEPSTEVDSWFNIEELCLYHPDRPSKSTVYGWVHQNVIPYHKGKKKLRFLKSDIDAWIKEGRKKTAQELANEAEKYLKRKGVRHA